MPSPSASDDSCAVIDAINNTVTARDVAVAAQRFANEPGLQVLKYELGPYSADKLGFLGCHRHLRIEAKRPGREELVTISLFVKSVPYDCQEQAAFLSDTGVFDEEYNFFVKIAPELLANYEGEKFAPTCYLAKPDCLIMEDLRCEGYRLRASFYDCYAEVSAALAALARFHACSMLYEAKLAKTLEKPTTLKELYPNHLTEKMFKKDVKSYVWVKNGTNLACLLGERLGYDPHKIRQGFGRLYELVKPSAVHRNVIAHSDLWTNNLMFDESEPSPKCVLVDFQVIRYGPQVLDVLKLLYLHTSAEFRRAHESKLIQAYQAVVEETVARSKLAKDARVPTLAELEAAMRDLELFGAGMASLYFPMVLMDPMILKEKTKDSQGFNDFVYGDRVDDTIAHMEENEVYSVRIKEALRELNRLCAAF